MHPLTIENDAVRMELWPQIGGKISSIFDKADNFELLFTYPAEIPDSPRYDAPYFEHWHSGWDECFPAIARSVYPRHPYSQITVPDHGELWGIPTTAAVPTKNGITTVWHGLRFGYRLTRKLYAEEASVIAEYTLANLSPFDFRFVWCCNSLMSMAVPVRLNPGKTSAFSLAHRGDGAKIDQAFTWPKFAENSETFVDPSTLPLKQAWKLYSAETISQPMEIVYPGRKRCVKIEYFSEDGMPAYWGIWINTGAWGGHRHFAASPTTGRFDQIDRSIKDNSAGSVDPFGRRSWIVKWTLGQAS